MTAAVLRQDGYADVAESSEIEVSEENVKVFKRS